MGVGVKFQFLSFYNGTLAPEFFIFQIVEKVFARYATLK